MKTLFLIIVAVFIIDNGCRSRKPSAIDPVPVPAQESSATETYKIYSDPTTWLLGYFNINRFNQQPHSDWFLKGKEEYNYDQETVNKLKNISNSGITIKIVLGTWCPDSRREVPRFMKILDAIDFPGDKLQFIGVDNMKISPIENYDALDIQRVPTFIFYRNNIESGRIIENPVTSLEQDMLDILTRNEK
jgi:thiol-disulfide isomerase/thioredoxin